MLPDAGVLGREFEIGRISVVVADGRPAGIVEGERDECGATEIVNGLRRPGDAVILRVFEIAVRGVAVRDAHGTISGDAEAGEAADIADGVDLASRPADAIAAGISQVAAGLAEVGDDRVPVALKPEARELAGRVAGVER